MPALVISNISNRINKENSSQVPVQRNKQPLESQACTENLLLHCYNYESKTLIILSYF